MVKSVRRGWIVAQVQKRTEWLVGNDEDKQYRRRQAVTAAVAEVGGGEEGWFRDDAANEATALAVAFLEATVHRPVGRKEHPGRAWYQEQGQKVRPMKQLVRQMREEFGS